MTVSEWKEDFKSFINELQIPRDDYKGIMAYIDEGAELLKEQEPVAPTHSYSTYSCGKCGCIVGIDDKKGVPGCKNRYCADCGRKVKWGCLTET